MTNRHPARLISLSSPFVVWSTLHGGGHTAPIAPHPCRHRTVMTLASPIVYWSGAHFAGGRVPTATPDPSQVQWVSSSTLPDPTGAQWSFYL